MKILAIETSCDETCAAVVTLLRQGFGRARVKILSNVVYSQIDLHKEFGGVVPSVAKRAHEEKIGFVVDKAVLSAQCSEKNIDAVAVTVGPGLAIALEVGIKKARELALKYDKPLIAVNHIEGHLLSPLADTSLSIPLLSLGEGSRRQGEVYFPCFGLIVSGGHTELILVEEVGKYKIIAQTIDDALGEALDKAARILGMPYPGGALLEKAALQGDPKTYPLPLPMAGKEDRNQLSYSGLKTAFYRLINAQRSTLSPQIINDLAGVFQNRAFEHLLRVARATLNAQPSMPNDFLVGGGVAANQTLRNGLEKLGQELNLKVHFAPMGLTGDNAAMIGIAAGFKAERGEFVKDINALDRLPRWRVDEK